MSGPLPTPSPAHDLAEKDRLLRIALLVLIAYLAMMLVPVARFAFQTGSWSPLATHAAALVLAVLARSGRLPDALRDWTPLLLGPLLYVELRWSIPGAGRPHADALVAMWESRVFPSDPSRTLAGAWPSVVLSEMLHAAYVSYYALMYVPPVLLWLRRRHREFGATVLALVVVYTLCFGIYTLFPVDGPRFLHGPASAPHGPVRNFVVALLESGSSRGTAFPSSHVAASLVAAVCALRFSRRLGWVVAVLAGGLAVGAVYGGYHYAIDIVAGGVTGALAAAVAYGLERRRARRRADV